MWTTGFDAIDIKMQGVIVNFKPTLLGDFLLPLFDFFVEKFFYTATL